MLPDYLLAAMSDEKRCATRSAKTSSPRRPLPPLPWGTTALGGASGGVSVLRPALATVRTAVMTAYLVAQNAVKRSRTAFAMTQLLLAFAVGALAVKLLGGEIGTPLLLIAIPVIAAWVLITSLTVGAWWAAIVLAPSACSSPGPSLTSAMPPRPLAAICGVPPPKTLLTGANRSR